MSQGLRMLPSLSAHQLLSSIVGQAVAPLSWRRAQHNYMFEMYFWLEKVILIGGISMLPKASMEQWCVQLRTRRASLFCLPLGIPFQTRNHVSFVSSLLLSSCSSRPPLIRWRSRLRDCLLYAVPGHSKPPHADANRAL